MTENAPHPDGVPVVVVTGVSEAATGTAAMALACDLPNPVTLAHSIGSDGSSLIRTVSDLTGVLDRTVIDLEHGCVPCAIREDILPTLVGLADSGRWDAIVARLPLGAEATQLCRVASYEPQQLAPARIAAVVNALEGCSVDSHLLGPELLCELPIHTFTGDDRGAAEVAAALLEYADVVAVDGELTRECRALVEQLARPGVRLVEGFAEWDGGQLLPSVHDVEAIEAWVCERPAPEMTDVCTDGVWRLRLSSERALHPERIQENLPELASGQYRTRGCFWVPTRPDALCVWDGAAGQLNIGTAGRWAKPAARRTDIVVTGLLAHGDPREELREAFHRALCTPGELDTLPALWQSEADGLEPWLGDMREFS